MALSDQEIADIYNATALLASSTLGETPFSVLASMSKVIDTFADENFLLRIHRHAWLVRHKYPFHILKPPDL